ncbi:hypothetical protein I6H07_15125 [Hafnia alvei]|uniref:hypothetical protein n=1 Tax=Hafnia alvei TaxID=569 RepID=UPI000B71AB6F|nr:hypothetical protein [Hafnia alvei]MBI0277110.1 hypothetical protein [Hafnia alvei]PNL03442.1 hypothetical protein CEQ28_022380 [Hafnia alvei]
MTSREQFEAWAPNYCWKYSTTKELAWLAWQASREAVEVELPTAEGEEGGITELIVDLCSEAIRAAGIKVKGE